MTKTLFSKSELRKAVGCPGFIIDYLYDCGRLPVVEESKGPGYPRHYHPDAIDIIRIHLERQK